MNYYIGLRMFAVQRAKYTIAGKREPQTRKEAQIMLSLGRNI